MGFRLWKTENDAESDEGDNDAEPLQEQEADAAGKSTFSTIISPIGGNAKFAFFVRNSNSNLQLLLFQSCLFSV